jgi:hypothetical protein
MLVLVSCAACGDAANTGDVDAAMPDAPPGVVRPVIGGVDVVEAVWLYPNGETASGEVSARFYDGHPPRFHREAMRSGACVLRRHMTSSCTPACTTGLCVEGTCEPWPSLVSAGRLDVTGLAVGVSVTPMNGLYHLQDPLPPQLFGDTATTGVPPLAAAIQGGHLAIPFPAGQDLAVRWTPAGDGQIRLTLNSNNQGHGLPYLMIIECEAADVAGEIAIPAAMLDAFPETFAWSVCAGSDCPPSRIRRYHRTTQPFGDHDVELTVASELVFGIEHDLP